jgi:hypothetical protein
MVQPGPDPDNYPPIDPREPVPDDPGELLPDTPTTLPPAPVEPMPGPDDPGNVPVARSHEAGFGGTSSKTPVSPAISNTRRTRSGIRVN